MTSLIKLDKIPKKKKSESNNNRIITLIKVFKLSLKIEQKERKIIKQSFNIPNLARFLSGDYSTYNKNIPVKQNQITQKINKEINERRKEFFLIFLLNKVGVIPDIVCRCIKLYLA